MVNITQADTYIVINKTILTENDRKILTMLYQPIIGVLSTNLFFTLWMELDKNEFMSDECNHYHLMSITNLSLNEIVYARQKLEAVGLLKTFYKENDDVNNYIYELFSPLSPKEFFSHPVLNIVLYNSLGKKEYEKIVNYFKLPKINLNNYNDITESFSSVFKSTPAAVFENNLNNIKMNNKLGIKIDNHLDFDLLISTIPKESINLKTFTKENKDLINNLAFIYNLDIDEIKNLILSSLNSRLLIDKELLRKNTRNYYEYQNNGKLPSIIYQKQPEYLRSPISKDAKKAKMIYSFENTSPYNFLKSKNNGAKPTERDLKLLEELMIDIGLKPAVVNVLISYVLLVNNKKLTKNYVLTIASSWKRLNIQTAEEAMQEALKDKKPNKNKNSNKKEDILPKWFDKEIEEKEISKDKKNEMENLLKEFK